MTIFSWFKVSISLRTVRVTRYYKADTYVFGLNATQLLCNVNHAKLNVSNTRQDSIFTNSNLFCDWYNHVHMYTVDTTQAWSNHCLYCYIIHNTSTYVCIKCINEKNQSWSNQKPNSWTYSFVESSHTWGFRIQCLRYMQTSFKPLLLGGGGE